MSKTLKILNEGFMRKYMKEDINNSLEKNVRNILQSRGYNVDADGADNYISAAAEYIDMSNEFGDSYSVEDWLHDTELNYPEDLEFMKVSVDECITEDVEKEVFHNDNGIDYDVIERSSSGKNALLNRGKQWIVAWNCPQGEGSWGQGHYFFDEAKARKVWEDKYVNESLKEGIDDYPQFKKDVEYAVDEYGDSQETYDTIMMYGNVPFDVKKEAIKKYNISNYYDESLTESKSTINDFLNALSNCKTIDDLQVLRNRFDSLKTATRDEVKTFSAAWNKKRKSLEKAKTVHEDKYVNESLKESLEENDSWDFVSDVYNALSDIMFKYKDKGVDKSDMNDALSWFDIHFWEMDFDESIDRKKLRECINRLNEAEMSDEDKADSALLRSIYNKTQQRANAKLTPEEKAVLDKYNLRRDSDTKNIRKSTPENPWGNSLIDQRVGDKFRRWNQDETKINLADRARKMDDRGAGYHATQGYYYDSVSDDHREVRDPKTGRWQSLKGKGLLDQERKHQDSVMQEPVRQMKDAIHDRKYHQQHVDNNNAEYDARRAKIQAEYEKKLRDNENSRKFSGKYHQKELDRSKDRIDKLLRRDKKNESYIIESDRRERLDNNLIMNLKDLDRIHYNRPITLENNILYDYVDLLDNDPEEVVDGIDDRDEAIDFFNTFFIKKKGGLYLPKGTVLDYAGSDNHHNWYEVNNSGIKIAILKELIYGYDY